MNTFRHVVLFSLIVFLFLLACSKDKKSNPLSYVDRYNPKLTATKGTTYTGNFLPIAADNEWDYTGVMSGLYTIKISGTYAGQPVNETDQDTLDNSYCFAVSRILSPIQATLSGISYSLLPEQGEADLGINSSESKIMRYYQATDSVVYIRAVPGPNGLVEVEDPVFMKTRLVVGDSWYSNPSVNTNALISDDVSDIDMTATCRLLVIGTDSVTFYNRTLGTWVTQEAVQVDEIAEFNGKIKLEEYGNTDMSLSGKVLVHLYLVENLGIVASVDHYEIDITGKITDTGTSLKLTISLAVDDELLLSYYDVNMAKPRPTLFSKQLLPPVQNILEQATNLVGLFRW
ncbi:hypothetical protein JW960_15815 [candidate division KSB1 bacterium]|nr:hypothetical protein [candidate division KSB1 bacterium]